MGMLIYATFRLLGLIVVGAMMLAFAAAWVVIWTLWVLLNLLVVAVSALIHYRRARQAIRAHERDGTPLPEDIERIAAAHQDRLT